MKLRPYQMSLVDAAREAFAAGHRRILLQLPTGGGKTVILSEVARTASLKNSSFLAMAHRLEIVEQIFDKLTIFGLSPSTIASGQPFLPSPTDTIVAMQQTLVRRLEKVDPPGILLVDEAHHIPAAGYQAIIKKWPDTLVIGLTATPCRLDGKPLKDYFDVMITGPSVRELINMESLAEFTYLAPPVDPNLKAELAGMTKRGGDYAKGELETAVTKKKIIGDIVNYYRDQFNGAPVLAFCVSVEHARQVSEAFSAAGFRAGDVHGGMKRSDRDEVVGRFRNGQLSIMTTCDLIGEGFDVPDCAGVLLLRPTASLTIFLQQVGRALRPKSDGSKAIILDHVGNVFKHGRPDADREWSLEGKLPKNQVKISQCQKCNFIIDPLDPPPTKCPSELHPETCPLVSQAEEEDDKQAGYEYVDGELVEYVAPVNATWAGDLDLKTAMGQDFARLVRAAGDNKERLEEIAKARNYKPGWVHVRLQKIQSYKGRFTR